jgi:hypothetical protein
VNKLNESLKKAGLGQVQMSEIEEEAEYFLSQ